MIGLSHLERDWWWLLDWSVCQLSPFIAKGPGDIVGVMQIFQWNYYQS